MNSKIKKIGMLTVLTLLTNSLAIAELPKAEYQTTPPKYAETTPVSYFDNQVSGPVSLGNDATKIANLNSGPQIQDIGGKSVSDQLAPQLVEIAGKGVVDVAAKAVIPEPTPRDPRACPDLGYNNVRTGDRITLKHGNLEMASLNYQAKVIKYNVMPTVEGDMSRVVGYSVHIEDQNGCNFVIRQSEHIGQTAAVQLVETLYAAHWNPNQSFSFMLNICTFQGSWCDGVFLGSSFKIAN